MSENYENYKKQMILVREGLLEYIDGKPGEHYQNMNDYLNQAQTHLVAMIRNAKVIYDIFIRE